MMMDLKEIKIKLNCCKMILQTKKINWCFRKYIPKFREICQEKFPPMSKNWNN